MTRAGQGPVLAAILGATAVSGFAIGTWIGSQPAGTNTGPPAVVASPSPSPTASPSPVASPSTSPTATPSAPAPLPPREILFEISGIEHDVSQQFDALPGWQIQWQTDGDSLAIAVTGDQNLGVVVDEPGPASGVTSLAPAGSFRLNIAAQGPWTITVVQGEAPTPTPVPT